MSAAVSPRPVYRDELVYDIGERDAGAEARLAEELGVSTLLAAALRARGIEEAGEAREFLLPSLDSLGDPELLPDFARAAEILLAAHESKGLVFVHGDYDADGVTSSALFDRFLKAIGCNVHTFVPDRMVDGYGVHDRAVEMAREMGAEVLLTCDCGVSAFESLELAKSYGMKVVVTDHHEPQATLPKVDAIVNPHLPGSRYPFIELCGAAVVFRVCEGLARRLGMPVDKYRARFLEFAALGTVADMMPLVGENRTIVYHGLLSLERSRTPGIQRLKEHARVKPGPMSARDIGFGLGPRLNAVGRIFESSIALALLLTPDADEAARLALIVEEKNTERRTIQDRVCEEALAQVQERRLHENLVLMVHGQGWHKGVVGLAASRLLEKYGRPVFVLNYNPATGLYGGSGRSIDGVSLFDLIDANRHIVGGGGHAGAAGIHFRAENFDAIFEAFERAAWEQIGPDGLVSRVCADFESDLSELSVSAVRELGRLEPCGRGNEGITLLARGIEVARTMPTKKPSSMRYSFRAGGGKMFTGITHRHEPGTEPRAGSRVDLLFRPTLNEYMGDVSVQLEVLSLLEPQG